MLAATLPVITPSSATVIAHSHPDSYKLSPLQTIFGYELKNDVTVNKFTGSAITPKPKAQVTGPGSSSESAYCVDTLWT